jgi:hypothetical protein
MQTKDKSGERGRNRTYNLLIKSQLLCQLSYAPSANREVGTNFDYSIGVRGLWPRARDRCKLALSAVDSIAASFLLRLG